MYDMRSRAAPTGTVGGRMATTFRRSRSSHFKDLSIFGTVLPPIDDEQRRQRLEQAITVRSSTFPLTIEATSTTSGHSVVLVARIFLDETSARFVSWREI